MEKMTQAYKKPYREMMISSDLLEVPRNTYQRPQDAERILKIASEFDEKVANEPKVSYRDGKYYLFDGAHTVAVRVINNGGEPLPILCKVYFGMT